MRRNRGEKHRVQVETRSLSWNSVSPTRSDGDSLILRETSWRGTVEVARQLHRQGEPPCGRGQVWITPAPGPCRTRRRAVEVAVLGAMRGDDVGETSSRLFTGTRWVSPSQPRNCPAVRRRRRSRAGRRQCLLGRGRSERASDKARWRGCGIRMEVAVCGGLSCHVSGVGEVPHGAAGGCGVCTDDRHGAASGRRDAAGGHYSPTLRGVPGDARVPLPRSPTARPGTRRLGDHDAHDHCGGEAAPKPYSPPRRRDAEDGARRGAGKLSYDRHEPSAGMSARD